MPKSSLIILTTSDRHSERLKNDLSSDFDLLFYDSGAAVLSVLQKKLPSAIIMDHSLEDFLTYRFIDKVRNNPVTRDLPFILVSRESNSDLIDQAVRSGVSHYIGIPYEPEVLVEKIKMSLKPGHVFSKRHYFSLKTLIDTKIISYGRISFISNEGIHFETRLNLKPSEEIDFSSPLTEAISEQTAKVVVAQVTSDVFYNYPFAVDAKWVDESTQKKVKSWIFANRHLNSPKKSKILFISPDLSLEEKFTQVLNKTHYSARFQSNLYDGILSLPFLNPAAVVLDSAAWASATVPDRQKFVNGLSVPWIYFGEATELGGQISKAPFFAPNDTQSIALAIQKIAPWRPAETDRVYLSKTLEDSRLKLFLKGQVRELSEMGASLILDRDVMPPCNLHLDLKIFSDRNIRNPYLRAWPPARRLSTSESEKGKWKVGLTSHFLGINDEQATVIRKWLRDEELKSQRELIADIPPKPGAK